MSGEQNLATLLSAMSCILHNDIFVFSTLSDETVPEGLNEVMRFREAEGTSLILAEKTARAHGLDYEYRCRMITLNVHSSLDAVGFIAKIATALAAADMGVNRFLLFFHDHLFVPAGREGDALRIIEKLRTNAQAEHD